LDFDCSSRYWKLGEFSNGKDVPQNLKSHVKICDDYLLLAGGKAEVIKSYFLLKKLYCPIFDKIGKYI